jgi:hypothetical protein
MPTLTSQPIQTASLTLRFRESRPYVSHFRVEEPPRSPAQAIDPLLKNPHFPPFLKWAFQAATLAFVNPRTRRSLFRALFTLAHRTFGPEARKTGQDDTGFHAFFMQALMLDDQSVQHCIDKEKRREPKFLRSPGDAKPSSA